MNRNILFAFIAASLVGISACVTVEEINVTIEFRNAEDPVDLDIEVTEMDESVDITDVSVTSKDLFFMQPGHVNGKISSHVRLVPAIEDYMLIGWKVFGLRDSHPLLDLGVINGDIITAFNGKHIGSISELVELGNAEVPVMRLSIIRKNEYIELLFATD